MLQSLGHVVEIHLQKLGEELAALGRQIHAFMPLSSVADPIQPPQVAAGTVVVAPTRRALVLQRPDAPAIKPDVLEQLRYFLRPPPPGTPNLRVYRLGSEERE